MKSPSPDSVKLSRAKKISRWRGNWIFDLTWYSCSGHLAGSATPVIVVTAPSVSRSMRSITILPSSNLNDSDMSAVIGSYFWMTMVPLVNLRLSLVVAGLVDGDFEVAAPPPASPSRNR